MSGEQFNRELTFQATMHVVARMLESGLITDSEFQTAQSLMLAKYQPVISGLGVSTP